MQPTPPNQLTQITHALWLTLLIIGQGVFAWYIFALYTQPIVFDNDTIWNRVLSNLHVSDQWLSNTSMAFHLFGGAILSIIGPLQLIPTIRNKALKVHKTLGRIYIITAIAISFAGLIFLASRGAIGGIYMNIGFGLYGILMIICALMAWKHAIAKQISIHRRWAIRLFALGMASWLYRVEYGLWAFINNGDLPGHARGTFDGPFDIFMDFAFYIPTLIAVECYFYIQKNGSSATKNYLSAALLIFLIPLISLGCYAAALGWWWPAVYPQHG